MTPVMKLRPRAIAALIGNKQKPTAPEPPQSPAPKSAFAPELEPIHTPLAEILGEATNAHTAGVPQTIFDSDRTPSDGRISAVSDLGTADGRPYSRTTAVAFRPYGGGQLAGAQKSIKASSSSTLPDIEGRPPYSRSIYVTSGSNSRSAARVRTQSGSNNSHWVTEALGVNSPFATAAHERPAGLYNADTGLLQSPPKSSAPVGLKAINYALYQVGRGNYYLSSPHEEARGNIEDLLGPPLQGIGALKCNIFVYDALNVAGAPPGRVGARIPVAREWGNPTFEVRGYPVIKSLTIPVTGPSSELVTKLKEGDVISDGHHVGLFTRGPHGEPLTVSAATPRVYPPRFSGVVKNDWGFRPGSRITIRRSAKDLGLFGTQK